MFVREKIARGHRYLYLVESVREGGRVRQQIVRALGRNVLHHGYETSGCIVHAAKSRIGCWSALT